jgi:tRNA modification GTPase
MPLPDDTIVALATPPGRGGLAVVRLSGAGALSICRALLADPPTLEARRATLVRVRVGAVEDEAVATWFQAPASFTGEDVVELSLHGSPLLASRAIEGAVAAGARMARAGEFTLRAFLNGKLDLAQAEAVRDLVNATTPTQARMAFDQLQGTLSDRIGEIERELFELTSRLEASVDFPEEGYHFVAAGETTALLRSIDERIGGLLAAGRRGRILREGVTAALVGRTNVGKSTLFNRLAGSDRAIVTAVPGTTRDLLTETVSVEGVPVTFVDTAGTRSTNDPVEREGVSRAEKARQSADLLVIVLDGSAALCGEDRALLAETAARPRVVAVNKRDAAAAWVVRDEAGLEADEWIEIAAKPGTGIEALLRSIARKLQSGSSTEPPIVGNVRHIDLLERVRSRLGETLAMLGESGHIPEEVVLSELGQIRSILEELTGRRSTEALLEEIFSRFCVGK